MSRISIKSWLAATTAAVALAGGATLATASPASGAAGGATIIRTDETGEVVVCDDSPGKAIEADAKRTRA